MGPSRPDKEEDKRGQEGSTRQGRRRRRETQPGGNFQRAGPTPDPWELVV